MLSYFLVFAGLGIFGLHQHDRSKSSGKFNERSNGINQKTMGYSYGIGNGASGPVRGNDSSSMSFFRCKIPIKRNPENDKHWIFFQVFFTEIHVYQSSIFLFPRLLFPSLCSVINLKCISKLNNYYELFHQVSHKKYKPVKVFFFINQFLACKSFSFFSSLNAHTSFKSTTSGHFKGSSSVYIISKLTYSFLLTGHTERFWT